MKGAFEELVGALTFVLDFEEEIELATVTPGGGDDLSFL